MDTLNRAKGILDQILKLMNFSATLEGEETEDSVVIRIVSEDASSIIGKKGQTLDALQFIVNRMVHKSEHVSEADHPSLGAQDQGRKRIVLDSEGYREKRKSSLESMARETAEIVRATGKPIALEDLNARERWIIHEALKAEQGVKTESRGEGSMRKLVIFPIGPKGEQKNPSDA